MNSSIVLSNLQMLDIFFRFASVGALALFFAFTMRFGNRQNLAAIISLICCVIAYVLLTAPIENEHYGWLRPPLLLLTNCTVYALLAVYWHKIHNHSLLSALPRWTKVLLIPWLIWITYFFIVERGRGVFHDVHDVLGFVILVAIVVDAIRDFDDDLVASRRDVRKVTITLVSIYMLLLTIVEIFFRSLKDHWIFSLSNALLIFFLALLFAYKSLNQTLHREEKRPKLQEDKKAPSNHPLVLKLVNTMQHDFFTENGMTIAKLADAMQIPTHQLRVLINQEMGFENFSQFLNSYRIPLVCEKLKDPIYKNTPILTLALEAGYNSIAPFNRAFKELKGMTPTQYRQSFSAQFQK
jgi:AraC-like DNA-binding protein